MSKIITLERLTQFWTNAKNYVDNGLSGKVTAVTGKGLSTNDLTAALKNEYDAAFAHSETTHAPSGAQVNVLEGISVNGTAATITSKVAAITVPTAVTQLSDAGNYALKSEVTTYDIATNAEIDAIFTA